MYLLLLKTEIRNHIIVDQKQIVEGQRNRIVHPDS